MPNDVCKGGLEAVGCLIFRNHQGLMYEPALRTSVVLMRNNFLVVQYTGPVGALGETALLSSPALWGL